MTQNNIKVAVTGGIGSGKSTVAEIIARQGYKVVSCDKIYSGLLSEGIFNAAYTAEFGAVLDENGKVDRKKLAAAVFGDEGKLRRLNEITHTKIIEKALEETTGERIAFCEVPLLFEGGYENLFDSVIVVLRDRQQRVNSVMSRDNISRLEVEKRLKYQVNYDNLDFEKYYVIHNDGDFDNLRGKTFEIIDKIIK